MVAIVSGNSLGLELTSLGTLGPSGAFGSAVQGRSGEQVYVNIATGNLVVQRRDDFLSSRGLDTEAVRTYNSRGVLTGDNGDWSLGVYAQQLLLTGTAGQSGSTLTRIGRDGSRADYTFNGSGLYITRAGSGAHDTISYQSGATQYERKDGSTGAIEKYSVATGKLLSVTDGDGNTTSYTYNGTTGLLTQVVDKSGETVWYDYTGTQLTGIRTQFTDAGGATVTRSTVRYAYDSVGRLGTVTVDLTPEDGSIADGKVYTTTYGYYDSTSKRITTLTQTDGSVLTFGYTLVGADYRLTSVKDALGAETVYSYDTNTRRTKVVDPSGKEWLYDYDTAGQLTRTTSPTISGSTITQTFAYDTDGNVVSITNGDGETATMAYDANGNQVKVTDSLGNTVVRTYNAANQLLTETISTAATPAMVNEGGISIVGSNIVKTGGVDDVWDSSFRSSGGLSGSASVSFKPAQADKGLMVGLTADPGAGHSYSTIDYALYCTSWGTLEAYENGTRTILNVSYAAGDTLRVDYDGSNVTYVKNGAVLRTAAASISQPLYVDSSFRHVGAKIGSLLFGATPSSGGVPLVAESNTTVGSGGAVSKTGGVPGSWDASVRGLGGYTGGAMVSFKASQTTKSLMVGLNSDPSTNDTYSSIDYAFYCQSNGTLCAYENGTRIEFSPASPAYSTSDTLKVVYDGTKVQYLKISSGGTTTVLREVTVSISSALYLDSSFYSADAAIDSLQFGKAGLTTVMAATRESGLVIAGDMVTKTGGTSGAWDSAARSAVGYAGQASLSFSAAQTDKSFMIGLDTDPEGSYSWSTLDWAFFCTSSGTLEIREAGSGNKLTSAVTYTTSDKLQITYDGSKISYLKNGVVLMQTAVTTNQALYVDSSFYHVGASVENLRWSDRAAPELTTRYVYAAANAGQLRYVITPEGRVTQYKYNAFGERIAEIGYPRHVCSISTATPTEAELNGWVTGLGDLSSTVRKDYVYDARGLLSSVNEYLAVNASGAGSGTPLQTQYVYDQSGRLLKTILQSDSTTGDETGAPTTTYTYDGLGRLLTVVDAHGALTSTVYTDSAQKIVTTSQSGAVETSVYDKAGRLISLARSGNGSTTYAYDRAGRLLMTTDPTGVRSFRIYDESGRQVGTVDGDGTLTETTYDKAGRITRVYTYATAIDSIAAGLVDASGVALNPSLTDLRPTALSADIQRWNIYDDAGQLVYEFSDDGGVTQHDYDGAGRLVRTLRYSVPIAVPASASLGYVSAQLARDAVQAGAADDRSERYFYDADGLLVASLDGEGYLTRHTYDNAGRKVQTRRFATAVAESLRAGGGVLATITPLTAADDQVDTYFYNARGQLVGHVDAQRYVTRNTYNGRGLLSTQTRYATPLAATPALTDSLDSLLSSIRTLGSDGVFVTAADDRKSSWSYTRDGQLLKTTNYEGTSTGYAYDAAGRLTATIVGVGQSDQRVTQFTYDAWNRKLTETSADGGVTTLEYNAAGQVRAVTDANGNRTLNYYDDDGRVALTINALGQIGQNSYNALGQLVQQVSYAGTVSTSGKVGGRLSGSTVDDAVAALFDTTKDSVTKYTYDFAGRLSTVTDAAGAITTSSYNAFGEVDERFVPWQGGANLNVDRRQDLFTYDRRGLLTQTVSDAAGIAATTATQFDAFGRAVQWTDANLKVRLASYDKLGRVVLTTDPLVKSVSTTYDAFGQVLTVKDEVGQTTGKVTSYTYDKALRSVTMTTPEGVAVTTVHTRYGQTYSIKDGRNTTTVYTYDLDGNLTQTKVGSTVVETRNYDAGGRLQSSADAAGVLTTYTYDAANRVLTRTLEPTDADTDVELNLTTTWTYDAKGQAISVKDARSVVTEYSFDLAGRTIKQVVDPTGLALKTEWTHDAAGRVLTVLDANLVTTQYTYDELGRRTQEQIDPTGLNLTRSYSYDSAGNVLAATDGRGSVTRYRYDDAGRLTYTADAAGSVTLNDYDAHGRVVKVTRFLATVTAGQEPGDVATGAGDQVTRYAYDDDGRLEYSIDAIGAVTKNDYDANGNVVKITRFADVVTSSQAATAVVPDSTLDHVTRIEYDTFDRETYRADAMGSVTRNEYDVSGNLVARTRFATPVAAGTAPSAVLTQSADRVERFVYDAANRLTHCADSTGAVTATSYDKNGNVTQITRYATRALGVSPDTVAPDSVNDRVTTYFYDRANRRNWEVDTLGYVTKNVYDGNGNLLNTRLYADKPDSRSTPSSAVANDTNDRVKLFEYDDANRLAKSTDALGATEEFTYDGAGNKLTFKNKNGSVWNYTYDAVGRLLTETSPTVPLYTVDGSTGKLVLSTGETKSIVTTLAYDSFGNLQSRTEATGRPEQRTTSYAYDKLGRQTKTTYPTVLVYNETAAERTANARLGAAARDEISKTPTTLTYYDVFGNAVSSVDRASATSYKAYDAAGRVAYEVDALGFVTYYDRNAFGEARSVTRYANATTLNSTAASAAATGITIATVSAAVNASGIDHTLDRKLSYSYDLAGRVITVTEPVIYTYDSTVVATETNPNAPYDSAGSKTTKNTYNAFGDLIQVSQLRNRVANTWTDTWNYYDLNGRQVATVDELGYLTTRNYDAVGNLKDATEYATALAAGAWTTQTYGTPAADDDDRKTTYVYDKLDRKTSETRVNVEYSTSANGTSVRGNLTTSYGYDAVGNLTRTTDAAGGITYSYYDALGRVRAVAAPTRTSTVDGSSLAPLVEFRRDAYGNVLAKIERANGATNLTNPYPSVTSDTTGDRATKTLYDSAGQAMQVEDALGFQHYNSYTASGLLAKTWQTVTDNDGVASTLYTAYAYDKLGRATNVYTPAPTAGAAIDTGLQYNAFGEVTKKGINGGWQETFEYDNAGRLWRTTSGAEFGKVFLYDLLGRVTAEISNSGSGRSGASDVRNADSVVEAAGYTSVRRADNQYDALGHLVAKLATERQIKQGGVTIRAASANAGIVASSSATWSADWEGTWTPVWTGSNSVSLSWTTLAYLGSGEVRVDLTYLTKDTRRVYYDEDNNPQYGPEGSVPVSRTESQIFRGDKANAGVTLTWTGEGKNATGGMFSRDDRDAGIDGITSITSLVVYKKNPSGDWVKVIDRNPGAGRAFGTYGNIVEAGSPIDPSTTLTLKYKLSTAPATDFVTVGTSYFGDSHRWDASALAAGTYDYQVFLTKADGTAELTDSGSFTRGVTLDSDDPVNEVWQRPVENFKVDRWGNIIERSDPRNATWKTVYRYNANNQVVQENQPNPADGDQDSGSPVRYVYFDKLGRQIATRDARGNVSGSAYDAGGNLVAETHADGGKITYLYNAFGERVRTIDALGNVAGASADTIGRHTTQFAYDKLGRLVSTTHGTTTAGAVEVFSVGTDMTLASAGLKNLTEIFDYDEAGRKRSQTNGADETTRYWYDAAGHVVRTRQPMGQATTAQYDIYGRKIKETNANGDDATWTYNYFGRLIGHTDLAGIAFSYTYDSAGLLTAQTSAVAQDQSHGQSLTYAYDAAGQLVQVKDLKLNKTSTFAYDLAGRHVREKVVQGTEVLQDNHLAYDMLGRLRDSADNRAHLQFEYDAEGNRTRVVTHVLVDAVGDEDTETPKNEDRYFRYDAMNRQVLVDGYADGSIGTRGHTLTYDVNGNRASDTFWGNKVTSTQVWTNVYSYSTNAGTVTESYSYDALGRLQSTQRDDIVVDERSYDGASRVVQSGPTNLPQGYADALNNGLPTEDWIGFEMRRSRYDDNGRLLLQRTYTSNGASVKNDTIYEGTETDGTVRGYDAVGNIKAYRWANYKDGYANITKVTLANYDGYVETKRVTTSTKFQTGTSTSSYDANGYLVGIDDATENTLDRSIANDASGRALRVTQNGNALYTHIVNGEILGRHGVAPNEVKPRTDSGQANLSQVAQFEFGYRSITGSYPAPSIGQYTVRQGDSLQGIAQAAYGDSRQWWRIAQANGLSSDNDLRVGQTLTLPTQVAGSTNTYETFKPYDPSEIVGDTSPNLPQPPGDDGCGGLGQILMVVVAVVVTIYTAGAMSGVAATSFGQTMAAGASALSGGTAVAGVTASAAGFGAGAVAAAAGSVASQLVGMAVGAQDSFSWKGVALGALSGGVSAGLASAYGPAALAEEGMRNLVVRAAVSNATTQGIAVVTGLQDRFSWTGVAAAAVGAGMGAAVTEAAGGPIQRAIGDQVASKLVTGTLAGMASGATVALLRGGRVSAQQIAADAFGNALGQGLVDSMSSPSGADNRTLLNQAERNADPDRYTTDNRMLLNEVERAADPDRYETSVLGRALGASRGQTEAELDRPLTAQMNDIMRGAGAEEDLSPASWIDDVGGWIKDKASQLGDALDLGRSDPIAERKALARQDALRRQAVDADNKKNGWFDDGTSCRPYSDPGSITALTPEMERPALYDNLNRQAALSLQDAAAMEGGGLVIGAGLKLAGAGWSAVRGMAYGEEALARIELKAALEAGGRTDLPLTAWGNGLAGAGESSLYRLGGPAGPAYRGVEIVDGRGSPLGEFDRIEGGVLIEEKSAQGLDRINPRTGKPAQTPDSWAEKQVYDKTVVRIDNLETAFGTRPTTEGSSSVPTLEEIRAMKNLEFRIQNSNDAVQSAVDAQLERLRQKYPTWKFGAKYGG